MSSKNTFDDFNAFLAGRMQSVDTLTAQRLASGLSSPLAISTLTAALERDSKLQLSKILTVAADSTSCTSHDMSSTAPSRRSQARNSHAKESPIFENSSVMHQTVALSDFSSPSDLFKSSLLKLETFIPANHSSTARFEATVPRNVPSIFSNNIPSSIIRSKTGSVTVPSSLSINHIDQDQTASVCTSALNRVNPPRIRSLASVPPHLALLFSRPNNIERPLTVPEFFVPATSQPTSKVQRFTSLSIGNIAAPTYHIPGPDNTDGINKAHVMPPLKTLPVVLGAGRRSSALAPSPPASIQTLRITTPPVAGMRLSDDENTDLRAKGRAVSIETIPSVSPPSSTTTPSRHRRAASTCELDMLPNSTVTSRLPARRSIVEIDNHCDSPQPTFSPHYTQLPRHRRSTSNIEPTTSGFVSPRLMMPVLRSTSETVELRTEGLQRKSGQLASFNRRLSAVRRIQQWWRRQRERRKAIFDSTPEWYQPYQSSPSFSNTTSPSLPRHGSNPLKPLSRANSLPKTQITPPSDPSSNVIGYNSDYDDDPNERHSYHLQPRIVAPFPATNIEARTQLTPAIRSPLFLSAIPSTAVVIASSPQGPRVTFATTPPTASVNPSTSPSANLLSVSARARISETVSQPVEAAPQFVYQRGGVRHDHNTVREDPAPSHIVELLTVKKKLPSIPVGKTSSDFPVLTPQTTSNNISQTVSLPPHNITVIDMPSLSENAAVLTSLLSVPVPSAAALKAHRCALLLAYLKGLIVRGVYRSREQRQLARQIADVYALLRDLVREHFRGPLPPMDTDDGADPNLQLQRARQRHMQKLEGESFYCSIKSQYSLLKAKFHEPFQRMSDPAVRHRLGVFRISNDANQALFQRGRKSSVAASAIVDTVSSAMPIPTSPTFGSAKKTRKSFLRRGEGNLGAAFKLPTTTDVNNITPQVHTSGLVPQLLLHPTDGPLTTITIPSNLLATTQHHAVPCASSNKLVAAALMRDLISPSRAARAEAGAGSVFTFGDVANNDDSVSIDETKPSFNFLKRTSAKVSAKKVDWSNVKARTVSRLDPTKKPAVSTSSVNTSTDFTRSRGTKSLITVPANGYHHRMQSSASAATLTTATHYNITASGPPPGLTTAGSAVKPSRIPRLQKRHSMEMGEPKTNNCVGLPVSISTIMPRLKQRGSTDPQVGGSREPLSPILSPREPDKESRPFAQMPVSKQQPTTRNVTAGLRLPKTMKLDSPTPVFPVIHSSHPTTSSSITATSSSGSVSVKSLTINTMHAHHNNSFSLESIDDIPARLPVDPELEVYQRKRQLDVSQLDVRLLQLQRELDQELGPTNSMQFSAATLFASSADDQVPRFTHVPNAVIRILQRDDCVGVVESQIERLKTRLRNETQRPQLTFEWVGAPFSIMDSTNSSKTQAIVVENLDDDLVL